MSNKMTARERFKKICSFELKNDPFVWSVDLWNETFDRWVKGGMPVENTDNTNVSFDTTIFNLLTPGTKMFIGPSTKLGFTGESESVTVNSTSAGNKVTFTGPLTNGFNSGDPIVFSKNIWFFNEHFLKTLDVGALYKIGALDGSILGRTLGGAFKTVSSTDFVEIDSFTGALAIPNKPFLIFIRTNNLLFIDINDSNLLKILECLYH